jgi:amidase
MGRTAADVALALQAMAGDSPRAPLGQRFEGRDLPAAVRAGLPRGLRLAYAADPAGIGVEPDIEQVCRSAAFELRDAGALVVEHAIDLAFVRPAFLALRGLWFLTCLHDVLHERARFGTNVANNVRMGLATTVEQVAEAEQARNRLWRLCRDLFTQVDAVITPCMAVPPFPVEQNYPETIAGRPMETYVDWIAPTFVWSMTGLPVASVPAGLDGGGMPVGLQIVGPPFGEERVLAVAAEIERQRPIGRPDLERLTGHG